MIEAILLQFLPPVWEVLRVCSAYHSDPLVNVEHVLLCHLIIPLLDLIQSPYHGIIVAFVAECPLHVHQQVPHRDVLAFIQHVGPFTRVPTETGEDVGAHTSLIILLEKGIHPWISRFKDQQVQSHGHQLFPSLLPLHLHQQPAVSLAVEYPSESGAPLSGEEGGDPPPLTVAHWDFGGLPCSCAAPVWGLSLVSVLSPIPEVLPSCGGMLPISWLEESDSWAAPKGVLRVGFSTRFLSLQ